MPQKLQTKTILSRELLERRLDPLRLGAKPRHHATLERRDLASGAPEIARECRAGWQAFESVGFIVKEESSLVRDHRQQVR